MRFWAVGVLVAAALAGCGGGDTTTVINQAPTATTTVTSTSGPLSKKVYGKKVGEYLDSLEEPFDRLQSAVGQQASRQQLVSVFASFREALQKASEQFAGLDPPGAAARSNADLVAALNTYEKSVAETEEVFRSGTVAETREQGDVYLSSLNAFNKTLAQIGNQMSSQGIPVPGL